MARPTAPLSVIIPAYDAERYLAETIDSVLAQSVRPQEILLIDDGSTDDTVAVARRYTPAVTVLSGPHEGFGAALNRGIAAARGEYIAFLDADDLWVADKLARQLDAMDRNPVPALVFGLVRQFLSPDVAAVLASRIVVDPEPGAGYLAGALLARRSAVQRIGAFRTDISIGCFIDWAARARELRLEEYLLPSVVMLRRLHGHNMTLGDRSARLDYVRTVKAALDRHRRR